MSKIAYNGYMLNDTIVKTEEELKLSKKILDDMTDLRKNCPPERMSNLNSIIADFDNLYDSMLVGYKSLNDFRSSMSMIEQSASDAFERLSKKSKNLFDE